MGGGSFHVDFTVSSKYCSHHFYYKYLYSLSVHECLMRDYHVLSASRYNSVQWK